MRHVFATDMTGFGGICMGCSRYINREPNSTNCVYSGNPHAVKLQLLRNDYITNLITNGRSETGINMFAQASPNLRSYIDRLVAAGKGKVVAEAMETLRVDSLEPRQTMESGEDGVSVEFNMIPGMKPFFVTGCPNYRACPGMPSQAVELELAGEEFRGTTDLAEIARGYETDMRRLAELSKH